MKSNSSAVKRSFLWAALLMLTLCTVMAVCAPKAYAANDGLVGANIKDGVLLGYYGNGGDIVIPNTVTAIDSNAFQDNDNVTSVTIPGSVSSIGYHAFDGCRELKSVKFANSKNGANLTIRVDAFANCRKLEDIELPAVAKYVTGNVFKGCTSLRNIRVDADNPYYFSKDGVLFGPTVDEGEVKPSSSTITLTAYPSGKQGSYAMPDTVNGRKVTEIWAAAFEGANNLTTVEIPSSVRHISGNAFTGSGIERITIPDTVTDLNTAALFDGCTKLKEATLPDSVTALEYGTFSGCTSLQKIHFPAKFSTLGSYVFKNCRSLTSVILPDTVTSITGTDAFEGCSNLSMVYLPPSIINFPSDSMGDYNIFNGTSSNLVVYAVKGSTAEKWLVNNAQTFGISYTLLDSAADIVNGDVYVNSLVDMEHRVKLNGRFKAGTSLVVKDVNSGDIYNQFAAVKGNRGMMRVYEISLDPSGTAVPENLTAGFGMPSGMNLSSTKLYSYSDRNAVTQLNTNRTGSTLNASVTKLGYYTLIDTSASESSADPSSITLDKTALSVETGQTAQLFATVGPDNAKDKTVTWSSSNPEVASVSSNGVVTGVKAGSATITAKTYNGLEASCTVTVKDSGKTEPDPGDNPQTPDKPQPSGDNVDRAITAHASITAANSKTSDGKASFSVNLSKAANIGVVTVNFQTDGSDAAVTAQSGFTLLRTDDRGNGNYSAVLAYLGKSRALFSNNASTTVAQIAVTGEKPSVKLNSIVISGWNPSDATMTAKYGVVDGVPASAAFTGGRTYDLSNDGIVDQLDLTTMNPYYRAEQGDSNWQNASSCDFNGDGVVDIQDFQDMLMHYDAN